MEVRNFTETDSYMATPKQVAMLTALFMNAGMRREQDQLDFLYENGMDVDKLEQLPNSEVTIAKGLLEEKCR